jgi:hypothetical protein
MQTYLLQQSLWILLKKCNKANSINLIIKHMSKLSFLTAQLTTIYMQKHFKATACFEYLVKWNLSKIVSIPDVPSTSADELVRMWLVTSDWFVVDVVEVVVLDVVVAEVGVIFALFCLVVIVERVLVVLVKLVLLCVHNGFNVVVVDKILCVFMGGSGKVTLNNTAINIKKYHSTCV